MRNEEKKNSLIKETFRVAWPAVVESVFTVLVGMLDTYMVSPIGKQAIAAGIKAGDLVRTVAKAAGGSGGGKPDSAMAGGNDVSKIDEALAVAQAFVAENAKK